MAYNTPQTWSLLDTQTVSGVSAVEFKSLISSNFIVYKVFGINLSFSANGTSLLCKFSTDNGSSYLNSNYANLFYYHDTNGTFGSVGNFTTASGTIQLVIASTGLQSVETIFYNLNSTNVPLYLGSMTHDDSIGGYNNAQHMGINTTTTPVTALQYFPETGTFSGTFYFYGGNFN